jgi:hypothetical protein
MVGLPRMKLLPHAFVELYRWFWLVYPGEACCNTALRLHFTTPDNRLRELNVLQPLQKPGLINRHVCHCLDCRKIGSAFYQSNITVADSHLKYVRGENNLATFEEATTVRANASMTNYFCKTCGTLMYRRGARFPEMTILRTGTVDDPALAETRLRLQVEQFIERRVAWSVPIEGTAQTVGMHQPSDIARIP